MIWLFLGVISYTYTILFSSWASEPDQGNLKPGSATQIKTICTWTIISERIALPFTWVGSIRIRSSRNKPVVLMDHFGPIHDTINRPLRSQGKKLKTLIVDLFPELDTVSWIPHLTSVNSPFINRVITPLRCWPNPFMPSGYEGKCFMGKLCVIMVINSCT